MQVRRATKRDVTKIKILADAHRHELGFVRETALADAVAEKRLFVAVQTPRSMLRAPCSVIGFVHFRCCLDGHATIYEIAVAPKWRGRGVGKALVNAVVTEAQKHGCRILRLKCPVDLPANGFYAHLGFNRISVETGKNRPIAVWELPIPSPSSSQSSPLIWQFFIGLTSEASQIRALVRRFYEGYNFRPPFNPFERIMVSPLFVPPATLRLLKAWRDGDFSVPHAPCSMLHAPSIMFDSGGYQVQMGKISYEDLCRRLRDLYERERWADFYVLPDHVPTSRDTDAEVERKITETLTMGEIFMKWFPSFYAPCSVLPAPFPVGVVHGRTERQVRWAARKWHELGVNYVAFGSFGTSGKDGSVNMLSRQSLKVLKALADETAANGQRLHIFGIGNPTYLLRLAQNGVSPTSFDSNGWWKAGGFGKVFFPGSQQWHITRIPANLSLMHMEMHRDGHNCPFCSDLKALQRFRWHRVLHNLVAFVEAVQKLTQRLGGGQ